MLMGRRLLRPYDETGTVRRVPYDGREPRLDLCMTPVFVPHAGTAVSQRALI